MNQIGKAIHTINHIQEIASLDRWVNYVHPLVKFLLTIFYIVVVVSCGKYDMFRVLGLAIYPVIMFPAAELSVRDCFSRIWIVLPFVCLIGLFNPLFDQNQILLTGTPGSADAVIISAGWFSAVSLILKGIMTVLAAYILIATTTIEKICYALQLLHVPKILITQVLLTYRYIHLLLVEAERVTQAYALRAPNQKGVRYKVWGSLVGQLFLRNIDRANAVYESMLLRGYDGSFRYMNTQKGSQGSTDSRNHGLQNSILFGLFWVIVILVFRRWPILILIGRLF